MSNLTYENTLLKAENAALKIELREANNKFAGKSSDRDFIANLKKDVFELEDELKTAETTIGELKNKNRQLQDKQVTDEQRSKISNYDWMEKELRDVKNGALEKENAGLKESLRETVAVENETLKKYISEQTINEKLRLEIKSLNGQLSSSYTRGVRDYWKNWFIGASVVVLFSFLMIFGLILRIT